MPAIRKQVVANLKLCYSLAPLTLGGRPHLLCASETRASCLMFDLNGKLEAEVWHEPGGVMSMQQIPGSDGCFLAVQRFYSPDDSQQACVVLVRPARQGDFTCDELCKVPFVHRIGILRSKPRCYLIACTLKSGHRHAGDFSSPGRVLAAELPSHLGTSSTSAPLELTEVLGDQPRNHGLCLLDGGGSAPDAALICSDRGVFRLTPPSADRPVWHSERLLAQAASDALLLDLDGDHLRELVTIEPFHGARLCVYHLTDDGSYQLAWQHPEPLPFLHAIWGGELWGKTRAALGYREDRAALFTLQFEHGRYTTEEIDTRTGTANVMIFERDGRTCLLAANRARDEVAIYTEACDADAGKDGLKTAHSPVSAS